MSRSKELLSGRCVKMIALRLEIEGQQVTSTSGHSFQFDPQPAESVQNGLRRSFRFGCGRRPYRRSAIQNWPPCRCVSSQLKKAVPDNRRCYEIAGRTGGKSGAHRHENSLPERNLVSSIWYGPSRASALVRGSGLIGDGTGSRHRGPALDHRDYNPLLDDSIGLIDEPFLPSYHAAPASGSRLDLQHLRAHVNGIPDSDRIAKGPLPNRPKASVATLAGHL